MRKDDLTTLREFPDRLRALVSKLTAEQLTTHYIEGEWTVAQNVHHLFDSHANSFIRCKFILTEDRPTLAPYDQDAWATLADATLADIEQSLTMLDGLHRRWVTFFEALTPEQWARQGIHQVDGPVTLEDQLRLYAAHCDAHIDQITRTLNATV